MKLRTVVLCGLLMLIGGIVCSQTSTTPEKNLAQKGDAILGVWRAEANGLPFITLTISNEGGSLSGAVLFYLHRREEGKPETATPGIPEPVFNLSFDGQTLSFQVSHRRAHSPRTLSDPPVTFHLRLKGKDSAVLNRGEGISGGEAGSGLAMTRSDY